MSDLLGHYESVAVVRVGSLYDQRPANRGVLEDTGSSGNIIAGNRFFNTPVGVQDPQSVDVAKLISPKR